MWHFVIVYPASSSAYKPSYYRDGQGWGWSPRKATKFATWKDATEKLANITTPGPTTKVDMIWDLGGNHG